MTITYKVNGLFHSRGADKKDAPSIVGIPWCIGWKYTNVSDEEMIADAEFLPESLRKYADDEFERIRTTGDEADIFRYILNMRPDSKK